MKRPLPMILSGISLACAATAIAAPAVNISMFPKARPGMQRHVIRVAPRVHEDSFKIEFSVGKTQKVDCNNHGLGDNLTRLDLTGWGYDYWEARETEGFSTLMGCPPGTSRTAFVSGLPQMVRYNSKLPVIVYVPKGYQVRYRIWVAGPSLPASPG